MRESKPKFFIDMTPELESKLRKYNCAILFETKIQEMYVENEADLPADVCKCIIRYIKQDKALANCNLSIIMFAVRTSPRDILRTDDSIVGEIRLNNYTFEGRNYYIRCYFTKDQEGEVS